MQRSTQSRIFIQRILCFLSFVEQQMYLIRETKCETRFKRQICFRHFVIALRYFRHDKRDLSTFVNLKVAAQPLAHIPPLRSFHKHSYLHLPKHTKPLSLRKLDLLHIKVTTIIFLSLWFKIKLFLSIIC